MEHLEKLYAAFGFLRKLTSEEREALAQVVRMRQLRRRQFVLQAGDICRHYTFVIEGCLRLYQIDTEGKEHCTLFAVENEWIADLSSAHRRVPTQLHIDALEPTTILQISIEDLLQLWNRFHIFDRYFRVITEDAYGALQQRLLLTYSAQGSERYKLFTKEFPHLVRRLPATQIASYLGLTPEFLSKIKKELIHSK